MANKGNLKLWVVSGDASFAGPKPEVRPGESVGLFLRLLRERSGLTVPEAAAQVRIREAYIQAIEDDRFESLPGRAYALGFVRAYAEFLGADVEATARAVTADINKLPAPVLRARKPETERASRAAPLAAATICLALAGYVYWYFENTKSRFEDAAATLARVDAPDFVESTPQAQKTIATGPYRPFPNAVGPKGRTTVAAYPAATQQRTADGAAPLPPSRRNPTAARYAAPPTNATAANTYRPATQPQYSTGAPAPDSNLPDSGLIAAGLPAPRLAAPQAPARWSIPAPGPAMAATDIGHITPSRNPGAAQAAPPPHASGLVILHAVDDTWIEIRSEKTGRIMFSRVLRQGERYIAPDRHGLVMTTGNAGGLEILVDGRPAPSLGGPGKVVRDVRLEGPALLSQTR